MTPDRTIPDLRELARQAERVADGAGLDEIAERLREHRAERDLNGHRISLVGEPDPGRTTLINQLLGRDVLPARSMAPWMPVIVRAATTEPGEITVDRPAGSAERRSLTDPDVWHGLIADRRDDPEDTVEAPRVIVTLPSGWLTRTGAEMIHTPRLDDLAARAVEKSDVVILTVSAQSPLSLQDRRFLRQRILGSRAPHVMIAVTGTGLLADEDAAGVLQWIREQAAALSSDVEVVVTPAAGAPDTEVEPLRARITELCHDSSLTQLRDLRLAGQIAAACDRMLEAADAVRQGIEDNEKKRRAAVAALKDQLAEGDLIWQQLHLELEERRLRFSHDIRVAAGSAVAEVFDSLDFDLHRCADVKRWGEHELPYLLRQKLAQMAANLETQTRTTVTRDLRWLDSEVSGRFGRDQHSAVQVHHTPLTPAPFGKLELDDVRRRRMLTRAGTAAGGIVGALVAVVSGIGIPAALTIGGSVLAGLVAEHDAYRRLDEQRNSLLRQLRLALDDILTQFDRRLPDESAAVYQPAADELRTSQAAWRTACLEALAQAGDPEGDITTWYDVTDRIEAIARQIPDEFDGPATDTAGPPSSPNNGTDQGENR